MHRLLISTVLALASRRAMWNWIHRLGGPGLVLLAQVDNSAIPLPGSMDLFTILLSAHNRPWWWYYAIMATVGATIGGYLTYRLAQKGGEPVLERKIGKERAEKVYKKFEKQGGFWIFIGAVLPPPFPIVPFLMAPGILDYPRKKFLAVLAAGRGLRYFAIAYVAHVYGRSIVNGFSRYYQTLLYAMIALGVLAGLVALVVLKWYLPRKRKRQKSSGMTLAA